MPYKKFNKFHKIRKLTSNNSTGDCYGITIPKPIALNYIEQEFRIYVSGINIILEPK